MEKDSYINAEKTKNIKLKTNIKILFIVFVLFGIFISALLLAGILGSNSNSNLNEDLDKESVSSVSKKVSIPFGNILYLKKINQEQELWTINLDEKENISKKFEKLVLKKLDSVPFFSVDNKKVLIVTKKKQIFLKKVESSENNEIENILIFESDALNIFDPSFGFNSEQRIIFVGEDEANGKQIYEYDNETKQLKKISNFDKSLYALKNPHYFSNGKKIVCFAITKDKAMYKILIIDSESGDILNEHIMEVNRNWIIKSFELSPDKSKIVYSANNNLCVLNIEDDDLKVIKYQIGFYSYSSSSSSSSSLSGSGFCSSSISYSQVWSPDSNFIVFDLNGVCKILDLSSSLQPSNSVPEFVYEGKNRQLLEGIPLAWNE